MFALELGQRVFLTLWLHEQPIHATALVVTRFPQVGNGFDFIEMTPEDRLKLGEFIASASQV